MIEINLLPDNDRSARKSRKAAAPSFGGREKFVVAAFAVVAFGSVGAIGFGSWNKVHQAKVDYMQLKAKQQKLEKEVAATSEKAQEIMELRRVFSDQLEILRSLDPPNRILWSEKIDMIADLMPSNVFLEEVRVEETVTEVELQSSIQARQEWEKNGKEGPQPEVVKKPVITHTLVLSGVTTGADNVEQFDNVVKFHDALTNHKRVETDGTVRRFMDSFDPNVEFETVEATLHQGFPVHHFIFKLKTKAPTSEELEQPHLQTAQSEPGKPSA